ncbi:alpha/beta hydrolase family protein [Litorilituus lipolyticus]|uniref:Alpha/beta fold hydrolase n=1 Tax=Litorilituus lipolyticus TaxID=2491017 RepID=A0A502L320_9GAMM|nr:alpha/beta fold hydrolase [Litorilituus lipolyticus]TPH18136.1 alpha/beta fold hydrolase [Litorilituus lipolyticus]
MHEINILCEDNYTLAATVFTPTETVKGAVLLGPATGIKRQFYQHFAQFLAEHGYGVITFDNRGIGQSLSGEIKYCDVTLQCWGEKDMPAVLEQLKLIFPDVNYHLIGHSAGGQLIGLMSNALDFTSMFNVACSSGQLRNMRLAHQVKAHFFMNFYIPLSNQLFGHTKSQWVGMGEPLPKQVAKQWQQWCNGAGYVKTAFGKTIHQHHYDDLTLPSMWINAIDDDIANSLNVEDMISVFPKLSYEVLTLNPADYGLNEIGHMKFFSRTSKSLWSLATKWLNTQSKG